MLRALDRVGAAVDDEVEVDQAQPDRHRDHEHEHAPDGRVTPVDGDAKARGCERALELDRGGLGVELAAAGRAVGVVGDLDRRAGGRRDAG